jgi:hypothetical protein
MRQKAASAPSGPVARSRQVAPIQKTMSPGHGPKKIPQTKTLLGLGEDLAALEMRWEINVLSGAPRSMKMGIIRSPWLYDAATPHALQSADQRRRPILRDATWGAASRFGGMAWLSFDSGLSVDPGIDAMCHWWTSTTPSRGARRPRRVDAPAGRSFPRAHRAPWRYEGDRGRSPWPTSDTSPLPGVRGHRRRGACGW